MKWERILRCEIRVSPDFKWTIGRRLPSVLRSFLTTWLSEDNGQRTNKRNSTQRLPKKRYKTLTTHVKERQENLQSKQENLLSKQVRMEQLTEEQQKQVKKMSRARIRQRLIKAGFTELGLEGLSREELMDALAEHMIKQELSSSEEEEEEEEEGAVGGAKVKKPSAQTVESDPLPTFVNPPMTMVDIMQWRLRIKEEEWRIEAEKRSRKRMKEQEEKRRREQQLREQRERERKERSRKLDAELRRVRETQERNKREVERLNMEIKNRERAHKEMMQRLFPNTTEQLSVNFETTTPEVVLQKQQLSVQDEQMNEEKEKEEAENAEKAKEEESCLEKAGEKEKEEEARAKEAEEAEEKVEQGNTEQQMSDKEADENDEDVEVCVRQVMQMPQMDRRYWVKLLLPLMTQRARTVINRVTLADRDNYSQRTTTERIQINPKRI